MLIIGILVSYFVFYHYLLTLNTMKTRQEIAADLSVSPQTLARWLKEKDITLGRKLISVDQQIRIYESFGMNFRATKLRKEHGYD